VNLIKVRSYWRFKTPEIADKSSAAIFALFKNYLEQGDFIGADMARKYLQRGFTRARRYANYKGGKKYDQTNNYLLLRRGTGESDNAEAARIFKERWKAAEGNEIYARQKKMGTSKGLIAGTGRKSRAI